jgi:hypothetical protein
VVADDDGGAAEQRDDDQDGEQPGGSHGRIVAHADLERGVLHRRLGSGP